MQLLSMFVTDVKWLIAQWSDKAAPLPNVHVISLASAVDLGL